MKIPLQRLAGLGLLSASLAGVGCEMHPLAQTKEGHAKKEAAEQTIERQKSMTPQGANTNAPTFFPPQAEAR